MRTLKPILAAVVCLLVLVTGVASAQSEEAPAIGPPPEQGTSQPEQASQVERFGDWGVRCAADEQSGGQACEMFQQISRQDSGETVMQVAVGYPPDADQPIAVFTVPLGTRLPPGVALSIDGGQTREIPIQVCARVGCRAEVQLDDGFLNSLRNGAQAIARIQDPRGRGLDVPVSLTGFTTALERLNQ